MTRTTALMATTAALWLLAPLAAGLSGAGARAILPLTAAMFAVQVAGKVHLLRPPRPRPLAGLAAGALLFAALGWAAGRGLGALSGVLPVLGGPVPWAMLAVSGAASWQIRGLSDPGADACLDEAARDMERASRGAGMAAPRDGT